MMTHMSVVDTPSTLPNTVASMLCLDAGVEAEEGDAEGEAGGGDHADGGVARR